MFQWTICDPLIADIIQKGDIEKTDIIKTFQAHTWQEMLKKQHDAKEEDLHFSPSIEFKNTNDGSSLSIVVIGKQQADHVFYAFYIPPGKTAENIQQAQNLSTDGVVDLLSAFVDVNHSDLSGRFKSFSGSQLEHNHSKTRGLTKIVLFVLIAIWAMVLAIFLYDQFNGTNLMSQISILSLFQDSVE